MLIHYVTAYFYSDHEVLASLDRRRTPGRIASCVLIPEFSNHIMADWRALLRSCCARACRPGRTNTRWCTEDNDGDMLVDDWHRREH